MKEKRGVFKVWSKNDIYDPDLQSKRFLDAGSKIILVIKDLLIINMYYDLNGSAQLQIRFSFELSSCF